MTAVSVTLSAAIRQGDKQLDSGAAIEYDAESLAEVGPSAVAAAQGLRNADHNCATVIKDGRLHSSIDSHRSV